MNTNIVRFGPQEQIKVYFNGKIIEQGSQSKYLSNILASVLSLGGEFFKYNYEYLCREDWDSMFCMPCKLKSIRKLTPKIILFFSI